MVTYLQRYKNMVLCICNQIPLLTGERGTEVPFFFLKLY